MSHLRCLICLRCLIWDVVWHVIWDISYETSDKCLWHLTNANETFSHMSHETSDKCLWHLTNVRCLIWRMGKCLIRQMSAQHATAPWHLSDVSYDVWENVSFVKRLWQMSLSLRLSDVSYDAFCVTFMTHFTCASLQNTRHKCVEYAFAYACLFYRALHVSFVGLFCKRDL